MATILLADDTYVDVIPYGRRLERRHHTVLYASTAEEVFKVLRSSASIQPVDLIVLDIAIPAEALERTLQRGIEEATASVQRSIYNGIHVFSQLKSDYPNIRVVIHTALDSARIKNVNKNVTLDCPILTKLWHTADEVFDTICAAIPLPGANT